MVEGAVVGVVAEAEVALAAIPTILLPTGLAGRNALIQVVRSRLRGLDVGSFSVNADNQQGSRSSEDLFRIARALGGKNYPAYRDLQGIMRLPVI